MSHENFLCWRSIKYPIYCDSVVTTTTVWESWIFVTAILVCCIFARSCRKFLLQLGCGISLDRLLSNLCNFIHINYKTDFNSRREISIEIFNKFEISGPCLFILFNSNYGCRIAYENAPNDDWFIIKGKYFLEWICIENQHFVP